MNRFHILSRLIPALGIAALTCHAVTYTWNVDSHGSWTNAANWDPSTDYPRTATDAAVFGGVITQPREVDLPANITVQQIVFDSAQSYTIVTGGSYQIQLEGINTINCISNAQGHHVIAARRVYTPGNGMCRIFVETNSSVTVIGDFEAPAQSGRGFTTKTGAGEFRVTGMMYDSNWANQDVVDGTLALEGGMMYRNSYQSQNNRILRIYSAATLRAGGTFGGGPAVTNSPTLDLEGTLDVFGVLNWNDGNLDLRDARKIGFELGAEQDKLVYTPATSVAPTIYGRTSGTTLLRFTQGASFVTGLYDLIDWSGRTGITISSLDLSDFEIEAPGTWTGRELRFDNGVTTADAGTTKLQLLVPIPEPASLAVVFCGVLLAFVRRAPRAA